MKITKERDKRMSLFLVISSHYSALIGLPLEPPFTIWVVAQTVKNPPATWETWAWSLHWEDPLEEDMATHSSILAWRIPGPEEPGGPQSMGSQRVGQDWSNLAGTHSWFTMLRFVLVGPHSMQDLPQPGIERMPSAMQVWQGSPRTV